jgi:hypothetical protein
MKNFILIPGLLLAGIMSASACDICGCAGGSNYMGMMPMYQQDFIGLRYSYRYFTAYNLPDVLTGESSLMAVDNYHTMDLMGRYYPVKRLQLIGLLPLDDYRTLEDGALTQIRAIGDASLLVNYILINTADSFNKLNKNTLIAGGGIKLPTGPFNRINESGILAPNMQPGTGSADYMANINYTWRRRKVGLSTEALFRINSENAAGYHYGNRVSSSIKSFYWLSRTNNTTWMPSFGIIADYSRKDMQGGEIQVYTGGYLIQSVLSLDLYKRNYVFGVDVNLPVNQKLSEGYVKAAPSLSIHFQYLFNHQKEK